MSDRAYALFSEGQKQRGMNPDLVQEKQKEAAPGTGIGVHNPNLFQDDEDMLDSVTNAIPAVGSLGGAGR